MGADAELLPLLDSASICCGVHAGSAELSREAVRIALELRVEIGAHPGYDDRQRFGREELGLDAAALEDLLRAQVGALAALAPIAFVKPHGALYHRCQSDPEAAERLARVAAGFGAGLVGQPGREILRAAARFGLPAIREGYADRALLPDGSLTPRSQPGSLLGPAQAAEQALRLLGSGEFDTVCLHGDSPGVVEAARAVRAALRGRGWRSGPLRPGPGPGG